MNTCNGPTCPFQVPAPVNGKGSKPRSGFNAKYRDNYDSIAWGRVAAVDTNPDIRVEYPNYCLNPLPPPASTFDKFIAPNIKGIKIAPGTAAKIFKKAATLYGKKLD